MFIGTTNQAEFLADETGNRRWLPLEIGEKGANVKAIENDRLQLWAEAKSLFNNGGIRYQVAETLAVEEHEQYTIKDTWQSVVEHWLNEPDPLDLSRPTDKGYLVLKEVLTEAIGLDIRNVSRREEMRMARVLRSIGYTLQKQWIDGKRVRVYLQN